MELIHIVENFTPLQDPYLLRKAELLKPVLRHETVFPESLPEAPLGKGDSTVIDFGTYLTGRVSLSFGYTGSHPDAPAHIGLFFAENVRELSKDPAAYHGWVSSSWIQDERLHLDILPANVDLPRRYSFRYLRITVLDTSPKYRLTVKRVSCVTETSASPEALKPYTAPEPLLQRIYDAGLLTLRNCMQDVFEDGPKRDRRLWLGDLRLTALANYASYRNTDLVKRCLYLFAGSRFPDGRISAAVFHTPEAEADDTCLTDYSLLFPVVLEEYLRETGDTEALEDLYGTAMQQMEISLGCVGKDGRVLPEAVRDAFFDWAEELDRTACTQAVLVYALRYAACLAERKGDRAKKTHFDAMARNLSAAARTHFLDPETGFYLSNGQLSAASQIWMVLAGVSGGAEARALMKKTGTILDRVPMTTPYIRHYYTEALLKTGLLREALEEICAYWGSMVLSGLDTLPEVWDPADPDASPYDGSIINSGCHAWCCTPVYLLKQITP